MGLGKRIEAIMNDRKMSIKELAEKANVPYNTLYACIKRDSDSLRSDYLLNVTHILIPDDLEVKSLYYANYDNLAETIKIIKNINNDTTDEDELFIFKLVSHFIKLNKSGKREAIKRVEELIFIPTYISSDSIPNTTLQTTNNIPELFNENIKHNDK